MSLLLVLCKYSWKQDWQVFDIFFLHINNKLLDFAYLTTHHLQLPCNASQSSYIYFDCWSPEGATDTLWTIYNWIRRRSMVTADNVSVRQTCQLSRVSRESHGFLHFLQSHGRGNSCSRVYSCPTVLFSHRLFPIIIAGNTFWQHKFSVK